MKIGSHIRLFAGGAISPFAIGCFANGEILLGAAIVACVLALVTPLIWGGVDA